MRCTKCGFEIKPNEKFCMHCGEKVPETLFQEIYALKEPAPPRPKRDHSELKRCLLWAAVSIALAVFMFFFAFLPNSIAIKTTGIETSNNNKFSLLNAIGSLVLGTERYNPSVVSIVMGITVFIFIFAASAFWLFSAVASLVRKGEKGLRRIAAIFTFLALGSACALPHLAYKFVSQFKFIYSRAVGVLSEDINGVSPLFLYIWTGIAVLLIVTMWILDSKLKGKER
ncbi:MAG: zinc ribbon domain-containing protein [Clostridiales bacterium]|jgi:hypothetical protein|nr:zinc ribbon domain-containing protein [Clostridiales bacterium]